jgi:archaeal type IV pilus assembly protein PilA
MKTLRKIRKNTKALSPVVASIILIAVTVAVSIAVAAWMGALTVGFMATEELKITNMQFLGTGEAQTIVLSVSNVGTAPVTLETSALLNGASKAAAIGGEGITGNTIPANGQGTVTITSTWVQGDNYQVRISSSKGNTFTYTAVAPSA